MRTITVEVRNVYGNTLVYPVCIKAHLFAHIANRETLSPNILNKIAELGYQVVTTPGKLPFTLKQPTTEELV
jgi:hypothetical protein